MCGISSPAAGLSVEPDVGVILWDSLRQGRIREVPAAKGKEGRFIELEGSPDLIVAPELLPAAPELLPSAPAGPPAAPALLPAGPALLPRRR